MNRFADLADNPGLLIVAIAISMAALGLLSLLLRKRPQ